MDSRNVGQAHDLLRSAKGLAALAELADRGIRGPLQGSGDPIGDHHLTPTVAGDVNLDDRVRLLELSSHAVSDWLWNPEARSAASTLTRTASAYSDLADQVSASHGAAWWWEPIARQHQVLLADFGSIPGLSPDSLRAQSPRHHPGAGLFYGELLVTSRYVDAALPAALLLDVEITSGLLKPISCWSVAIDDDARVLEIQNPSDWLNVCDAYPVAIPVPQHWTEWGVESHAAVTVDWDSVRADWDAVHISMSAVLTATDIPLRAEDSVTMLEGFCTDLTVWFSDVLSSPTHIGDWADT